jgi:1-acyl-sn-glycerol-3-phosphate acyltransferase
LKRGEMVLLFPEGTRTPDGEVHPMKPGFCTIARRAGVPLIPVALDGSFEAWPRQRAFPRTAVIHVQYGTPIAPQEIAAWSDEQVVAEVEGRIRQCHALARSGRLRAQGRKLASAAASG